MDKKTGTSRTKKLIMLLGVLAVLELIAGLATHHLKTFKQIEFQRLRKILAHEGAEADVLSKYLFSSYLWATPNPAYKSANGILAHNKFGYRGLAYPTEKPARVYRIVCLGGSTTYGFKLERYEDTYPYYLERKLNESIRNGALKNQPLFDSVQVINAGIEGANMFVMLAQYMYKYRLFHPDMVIAHEGINDAYAYAGKTYSPDYTHLRTNLPQLKPLPEPLRWCMKSNLLSLIIIGFTYSDAVMINKVVDDKAYPQWARCEKDSCDYFDKAHNAFYQNSVMLSRLTATDSVPLIFFPMMYNQNSASDPANKDMKTAVEKHTQFWQDLGNKGNPYYLNFNPIAIDPKLFFDACHLTSAGNAQKVDMVSAQIETDIMQSLKTKQ